MTFKSLVRKVRQSANNLKSSEVRITLLLYLSAGLLVLYILLDLYRPHDYGIEWQPKDGAEVQGTIISVRYLDVFGASQAEVITAGAVMLVVGSNYFKLGADSWITLYKGGRYFCWEEADRCYPLKS